MRMARLSDLNRLAHLQASYPSHCMASEAVASNQLVLDGILGMGLICSFSGRLKIKVNESAYTIDENSFVVINQGSWVKIESVELPSHPAILLFKDKTTRLVAAELFHTHESTGLDTDELLNHELIEHIHFTNASLVNQLKVLEKLGQSCASFQTLKADALVRDIITKLSDQNFEAIRSSNQLAVKKQATRTDLFRRLAMCRQWMEQNFQQVIDMEVIASMAMMDKAHFSRNFKAAFGTTPYQYLMNRRLAWASERLLNSSDSIQSISEAIGFETPSSFSYQFKKWKGTSPRALRNGPKTVE